MKENDFSQALLREEASPNVAAMTRAVLRRDRRRIWLAASGCIVAWMLAVMLPWATVMPMMAKITTHLTEVAATNGSAATDARPAMTDLADNIRWATIATFIGSIASMLLAAICTVGLVFVSRRATLRQVSAELSVISAQLKQLATKSE